MKAFLAKQPGGSIGELQAQIDRFVAYYNEVRPHRARGACRRARVRCPGQGPTVGTDDPGRCRRAGATGPDRQEREGDASPPDPPAPHRRGHAHKGKRVILLVDGLDVRVVSH